MRPRHARSNASDGAARLWRLVMAEAFFARHLGGDFEPVGDDLKGSSHEIRAGADLLANLGVT